MKDLQAPLTKEKSLQNGSLEQEEEDEQEEKNEDGCDRVGAKKNISVAEQRKLEEEKQRQKKKYTRLSRLRRRRCAHKDGGGEDDSDLSEGFESEEEDDDDERRGRADSTGGTSTGTPVNPSPLRKESKRDPLGEEGSWESGSEEEEGGTAFDVETDSDMNSQESRSDLEDIEDTENSDNMEGQAREHQDEEDDEDQPKEDRDGDTPPATNGPLVPNDSSISSNLQAMSSQLFQAKRCFRLAPTFSNVLLRPQGSPSPGNPTPTPTPTPTDASAPPSQETPPPPGDSPCSVNPTTANGTNENGNKSSLLLHT